MNYKYIGEDRYLKLEDNKVSIKAKGLNKTDIDILIKELTSISKFINDTNPISVLKSTAKRYKDKIIFKLEHKLDYLEVDRINKKIPNPNIGLTKEQFIEYKKILTKMLDD